MKMISLYNPLQICCLMAFLFWALPNTNAQSPYKLGGLKDGLLVGVPIGVLTFSRYNHRNIKPLTLEDLDKLKRTDVFAIDRGATYNNSALAKKVSDVLLHSSYALPLTMLAGERSRKDFGKGSLFMLEALAINSALTDLTKTIVKRSRPLVYNDFVETNLKLTKGARTSFFSGHTSTVASMYFLTAKMYSDYYPDSKLKPVVWSTAFLIPATTGLMRMKAGKHYFTDVLTGLIVGAAVGILVPELHKL